MLGAVMTCTNLPYIYKVLGSSPGGHGPVAVSAASVRLIYGKAFSRTKQTDRPGI